MRWNRKIVLSVYKKSRIFLNRKIRDNYLYIFGIKD
jgi:hypothetical protein